MMIIITMKKEENKKSYLIEYIFGNNIEKKGTKY